MGNGFKQGAFFPRGTRRLLFDRKAEHGGKAQQSQHAQRVLRKARFGVADAAQHSRPKVPLSAERVDDRAFAGQGDRVYREIAAGKILLDALCKGHAFRMPVVPVRAVAPHGGDLDGMPPAHDRHRAVRQSRRMRARAEERHQLLRQGVGGHVIIRRLRAAQKIAHAAADEVRRISRSGKRLLHVFHIFRDRPHDIRLLFCKKFGIALAYLVYYNICA